MIKLYTLLAIMLAMSGSRGDKRGSKIEGPQHYNNGSQLHTDGPHQNDDGSKQYDDEPHYDDDGSPHHGAGPQHNGNGPPFYRGRPPHSRGGPQHYRGGPQNYGNAQHGEGQPFYRGRPIRYRRGQQHDNYGPQHNGDGPQVDDDGPQNDDDGTQDNDDGQTQYDDGSPQYGDGPHQYDDESPHTDYFEDKAEYHDPKKLAMVVRKRQECLQHVVKFLLQELTWHNLTLEDKTICLRRALIFEQGLLILCRRLLKTRGLQMKPLVDKIKPVITSIDSYLEDFMNSNDTVNIQRSISNYKQVFIVQYDLFTNNIIQYNTYHDRLVTELWKIQEPDEKRRNKIMSKYVKKLEDNFNITDYVPDYYDDK